jgi:autotransporter family porin
MTHTVDTHTFAAHRSRLGTTLAALTLACTFASALPARADVIADGDVTPLNGTMPTDLPIDGGITTSPIVVGVTDLGVLAIDVPAFTDPLESPSGTIGLGIEAIGIVNVSGLLSEWTVSEFMTVGVEGQGYLNITSGARVETDVAAGMPEDPDAIVGELEGSQGFVTINGIGSRWRHNTIRIGDEGNGNLTVSGGGRLETLVDAYVGYTRDLSGDNALGTGYVDITGTGSRWNVEEDLIVARQGRADVYVRAGGMIDVKENVTVASNADSFGSVTVADLNSTFWTRNNLIVGSALTNAHGQLHIDNGGLARVDNNLTVGPNGLVEFYTGIPNQPVSVLLVNGSFTNNGVIRGSGRIEHAGTLVNNGDIRNATYTEGYRERLLFTGAITNNENIESVGGEMEFLGAVNNATINSDIVGVDAILRFEGGLTNAGALFLDNTLVWSPTPILSTAEIALAATESAIVGGLQLGAAHTFSVDLAGGRLRACRRRRLRDHSSRGHFRNVRRSAGGAEYLWI